MACRASLECALLNFVSYCSGVASTHFEARVPSPCPCPYPCLGIPGPPHAPQMHPQRQRLVDTSHKPTIFGINGLYLVD